MTGFHTYGEGIRPKQMIAPDSPKPFLRLWGPTS